VLAVVRALWHLSSGEDAMRKKPEKRAQEKVTLADADESGSPKKQKLKKP